MNTSSRTLPSRTAHLSEEALDAILLGSASPADEQHLAGCEACAGRLAEFRSSLAMFNQASAGWSEARSNTISRELTGRKASHTTAAAWSLASVTALAVALALTNPFHRSPDFAGSGMQESQAILEQAPNRQQEIASDNAMLVAIDSEISQPVPSPVAGTSSGGSVSPVIRRAPAREVRN